MGVAGGDDVSSRFVVGGNVVALLAMCCLLGSVGAQNPPTLTCYHPGGLVAAEKGAGPTSAIADPAGPSPLWLAASTGASHYPQVSRLVAFCQERCKVDLSALDAAHAHRTVGTLGGCRVLADWGGCEWGPDHGRLRGRGLRGGGGQLAGTDRRVRGHQHHRNGLQRRGWNGPPQLVRGHGGSVCVHPAGIARTAPRDRLALRGAAAGAQPSAAGRSERRRQSRPVAGGGDRSGCPRVQ